MGDKEWVKAMKLLAQKPVAQQVQDLPEVAMQLAHAQDSGVISLPQATFRCVKLWTTFALKPQLASVAVILDLVRFLDRIPNLLPSCLLRMPDAAIDSEDLVAIINKAAVDAGTKHPWQTACTFMLTYHRFSAERFGALLPHMKTLTVEGAWTWLPKVKRPRRVLRVATRLSRTSMEARVGFANLMRLFTLVPYMFPAWLPKDMDVITKAMHVLGVTDVTPEEVQSRVWTCAACMHVWRFLDMRASHVQASRHMPSLVPYDAQAWLHYLATANFVDVGPLMECLRTLIPAHAPSSIVLHNQDIAFVAGALYALLQKPAAGRDAQEYKLIWVRRTLFLDPIFTVGRLRDVKAKLLRMRWSDDDVNAVRDDAQGTIPLVRCMWELLQAPTGTDVPTTAHGLWLASTFSAPGKVSKAAACSLAVHMFMQLYTYARVDPARMQYFAQVLQWLHSLNKGVPLQEVELQAIAPAVAILNLHEAIPEYRGTTILRADTNVGLPVFPTGWQGMDAACGDSVLLRLAQMLALDMLSKTPLGVAIEAGGLDTVLAPFYGPLSTYTLATRWKNLYIVAGARMMPMRPEAAPMPPVLPPRHRVGGAPAAGPYGTYVVRMMLQGVDRAGAAMIHVDAFRVDGGGRVIVPGSFPGTQAMAIANACLRALRHSAGGHTELLDTMCRRGIDVAFQSSVLRNVDDYHCVFMVEGVEGTLAVDLVGCAFIKPLPSRRVDLKLICVKDGNHSPNSTGAAFLRFLKHAFPERITLQSVPKAVAFYSRYGFMPELTEKSWREDQVLPMVWVGG